MSLRPLLCSVLLLTACSSAIQHGLDEREANEVISALTARGFTVTKVAEKAKKPTWAIEVDDDEAIDAMRVLNELKLPRPQKLTTQRIASEQSLIETPGAERLRQLEAKEGDLEQTLETLDGVTTASVELVVPPPPRPGAVSVPSKASVLLRVVPDAVEHVRQQRDELRALVGGSVDGLTAENVVLVISEVQTQVSAPAPHDTARGVRLAVVGLGSLVALLALALVVSLRRKTKEAAPVEKPSATTKPIISAAVQRKAA